MIKETWKWEKTGQGKTRTITSKRSLYIYRGGTENNKRRGDLCVLKYGLSEGNWIVEFVSGPGPEIQFVNENNLEAYK